MATSVNELPYQGKSAIIAGTSILIMALVAFFSYGFVHGSLVVQGDARATWNNVISSNMLFKAEIFGWVMILLSDIVVAWALYIFLKPINKNLSLLGACFRLIYAAILGIAILNLIILSFAYATHFPLNIIRILG